MIGINNMQPIQIHKCIDYKDLYFISFKSEEPQRMYISNHFVFVVQHNISIIANESIIEAFGLPIGNSMSHIDVAFFKLISFEELLILYNYVTPIYSNLTELLQLVIAKWDEWN